MNRKSTTAIFDEDAPITQSDIKSGQLVVRKGGSRYGAGRPSYHGRSKIGGE